VKGLLARAINSHLWIGACAFGSYIYTTSLVHGLEFSIYTGLFIWSSTTFLYSILQDLKHGITSGLSARLLTCAIIMLVTLPEAFSFTATLLLIPSALVSVLYGARLKRLKWGLRAVPFVKIYLISVVWVVVTSVIPIVDSEIIWTAPIWLFLISQLFYLLAVTLPFDIRDLIHDDPAMKTLPQLLGFKSSRLLSGAFLFISTSLALVYSFTEHGLLFFTPILITFLLSLILIRKVQPDSPKFHFTGLIDGLLFCQGVLVWIFAQTLA